MEAERNKVWPATIRGTYRREGSRLVITGTLDDKSIEWRLRTLVRPKF